MTESKALNLSISCPTKTPRDIGYPEAVFAKVVGWAFSLSSAAGSLPEISLQISYAISSGVFPPPPPETLGYKAKTVSDKSYTVVLSNSIFAFGWSPKTSGSSSKGNPSI